MSEIPTSDDEASSRAVELVRALLERHDLPKHRHASFVGEFFNLSRAASHQRVNKSSAWTLDDFQKLANHFGESLAQVLGATSSTGIEATLNVGGLAVPCRIWLEDDSEASGFAVAGIDDADSHSPRVRGSLVAMEEGGVYVVVPATAASGLKARGIARLEIDQSETPARRVAVFDDERDVANSVCEMLRAAGIDAKAFYSAADFEDAISKNEFDGYVADWLLPGGATAVPFLVAVRGLPDHRALVILSGKTRNGMADPSEVGQATIRFKAQMVEKPVLWPQLVSALLIDGLNATRPAGSQLA
ncbi:CheY-like chemotaxis protein [Variovorax sp. GrIS 2.14]|uniref:helix-turn-helix domain-containing protein n=1 Tax=Variovorax sp. GrIS 2.14 TaxID=3071709 RepID=UPI0038F764F2